MKGEFKFVVSVIGVKSPVPVTCTLYSISATVIEVVSGWSHIKLTLLDSVVEFLRLVTPGSTTRIQRNDIKIHKIFLLTIIIVDYYYSNRSTSKRNSIVGGSYCDPKRFTRISGDIINYCH